jgi:DNA-binding beta-propeller fold protein YncE
MALLAGLASHATAGMVVLVAGGGTGGDGSPATSAKLTAPFGVDFDRSGAMFIVEMTGNRLLKVDSSGTLIRVAGNGEKGSSGDDGPAKDAKIDGAHSLAIAPTGDIYLADTWNSRVRKIDGRTGVITTFAGRGKKGFGGDGGPAIEADFGNIYCVAFDPKAEHMYLADLDNRRIRAIDMKTNIVTTIAGNGRRGVPEGGADAASAPLVDPRAVAADASGNVYVLERSGHALRVVDPHGKIRTAVGTGMPGNTGDGGDGRKATLRGPKHLCIDLNGDVLIADTDNHRIRRFIPSTGMIMAFAGTGEEGSAGLNGPPEKVQLNQPHGVFVVPSGDVYIADSNNHRVLKVGR